MSAIRLTREGRAATLTLDRPPLNILDLATLAELDTALERLAGDDELQLLVLRGAGDRAFSAGVAVQDHTPDKVEAMLERFHAALRRLLAFPVPTVAAVHGSCLGGGMELAACCDLRLADERARFGQPEIELGCFPPLAAALYPVLLGRAAAFDLVLTGRLLDASEAVWLGFCRLVPAGGLDAAVAQLTAAITAKSAAVTRLAVRALRAREGRSLDEALAASERIYRDELCATADLAEGLAAFLDKRPPRWQHR